MESNITRTLENGKVCPHGLFFPLVDETNWNPILRGTLYFIALIYAFIGVSVVTDIFMGAVVTITSQTKKVYLAKYREKKEEYNNDILSSGSLSDDQDFIEVRIWNDTVANLTLMALGTSAPEILLACIEIISHNFQSGELGPGTIVGSAAFNLLLITAICLLSIPKGQSRRIRLFKVFLVCSLFSIFAYVWLWIILNLISPHIVELWEAIVTFLMFPGLVFFAYATDKGWMGLMPFKSRGKRQIDIERARSEESERMINEKKFFKDGKVDKEGLVAFVRELKKYPGVSDEDAAVLAASKIIDTQPKSVIHYRINAIRGLTGGRKTRPRLSLKLQEVYDTINQHPSGPNLGTIPEIDQEKAIVEFHAATCAVRENIGSFYVTIWRHGNLQPAVTVRVESVDGSAKVDEDYIKIDEIVTFESGEREKQVLVQIVDDNTWEPDEEFFLKLSLIGKAESDQIQIGRISIMEITIIDDDKPGVISFDKRGILVKESAEAAIINVRRKFGADGEVSVKWRTIDQSAVSGRDFVGGEGEIVFKHREIVKTIEIPIINDLKPEKDECFIVELFSPSNNASLGNLNRTFVTITNDDAFANIIDKMMTMTSSNLDSLSVCRKNWAAQIKDAMNVNGGNLSGATAADYLLHLVSFNWKVLFSLIPPPNLLNGWVCFVVSLIVIGLVTAIIEDIATIFGCVVGLKDAITAITLVAMGTSLPDTFASRAAALKEQYADTSVGNITGSNSVNVFLGLGLPWLIATIYHTLQGTEFRVPSGTLGFSVLIFTVSAVIAVLLLIIRRNLPISGKAELGGPTGFKIVCGGILILLWILYIVMSCLQEYQIIDMNF